MFVSLFRTVIASKRLVMLIVGIGSIALIGVGYFLQYVIGLTPCALCIIQRGFFLGVGVTALIGAAHNRFLRHYQSLMFVLALFGGGVALRNVYIQLVPQGLGTKCLPFLASLTDAVAVLFQATSDCTLRNWTLLGLSIPEWSLISFTVLIGISAWLLMEKKEITSVPTV